MITWHKTDPELQLSSDYIDIWLIDLAEEEVDIFTHQRYLDEAEMTRAGKYVSGKKSREFIITRSSLRNIIGYTLGEDPRRIGFGYTRHGMPVLDTNWESTGITFNVSHSHGLALIAVSTNNCIGIDIELERSDVEIEKLARRYFSKNEYEAIMAFEGNNRRRSFFATWTRKEALVKATGTGIAYGLASFDVSVDPDQPARLLASRWQQECLSDWSLEAISTHAGYQACLAVDGNMPELRYWRL